MSFDKKLKALRLENEMTQEYIAQHINVSRSTIAGYETKNRQPSHEKLTALANLFHVSVDYLLDDDDTITLTPSANGAPTLEEQKLLHRYRKLSARSKRDVMEYIHLMELRDND